MLPERVNRVVRIAAAGAGIGALVSVMWILEVLLTVGPIVLGVVVAWLVSEAKARRLHLDTLPGVATALLVMLAAHVAPVKFVDRRIEAILSSDELPLRVLVEEFASDTRAVTSGAYSETIVRLPSRRPTYRQLDAALRGQAGFRLRVGYCGNGASLLFGAHPIGPMTIEQTEREGDVHRQEHQQLAMAR
jgi:hypothetical protein